jgi:hypothetical protein
MPASVASIGDGAFEACNRLSNVTAFNDLQPGVAYQLQVSTDLNTWRNAGPTLTATAVSELYPQFFDLGSSASLFFLCFCAAYLNRPASPFTSNGSGLPTVPRHDR